MTLANMNKKSIKELKEYATSFGFGEPIPTGIEKPELAQIAPQL